MYQSKKSVVNITIFTVLLLIILLTYIGCGSNINENTIISSPVNIETLTEGDEILVDSDDSYYAVLEKKLNDELDFNRAPDKCAAQGLTKIVLNFTTDEIQTCSTYDLSKMSVTAYFSDKTAEIVMPTWSIYSGGGTLAGTIYTATNKPAIIVFKALYSENGISKLALFRLTVTGLISISLNKTTDEIQLPATYDLSTELIITAKLSNGATKAIVKGDPNLKWMLTSGAGALVDGVYTPSAKVATATFTANYTENGVTKAAQFKLKVAGLSSLTLSKTTDEINSCETYDLASKIIVSNKLSNGSINDITSSSNLTWTLSSGAGIFTNKTYVAPARAETAVFTASYTEAGITKTAQFRLKVTGLSSIVLDKTTDEIMLPATYDLASEVNAIVKFSDGESKSVDLIWALSSGSGNLSGSLYTPAAKTETAVFIGSYTENGITKTVQFRLKVIGLSSLTLSKTTDEVASCATYDLSQIIVSDKLSNGMINNITNSTTWKLISGFGILSGMTYAAPARAETAAFTANYTEAGITKTVQFRLKVIALASIKLSKMTDEAQILAPYDLTSNIAVTARLSNGQLKPVLGNDPNLKWTLSYSSGILSGTIYTPPERIETAVLTATYTENGVAQSAQLRLKSVATIRKNVELIGLALSKTTDSVAIGKIYDLSQLTAIAKFVDKTTVEVSLSWVVLAGGGSVTGTLFTAPNNEATVKLMGSYAAKDGSIKSVYFTIKIVDIYNVIESVSDKVDSMGGYLRLNNGMMLCIPQNAVSETAEVVFQMIKHQNFNTSNDLFFCVKTNVNISDSYILIPPEYAKNDLNSVYAETIDLNSNQKQKITVGVFEDFNNINRAPNRFSFLPEIPLGTQALIAGFIPVALYAAPRVYHWATVPYLMTEIIMPQHIQLDYPFYEQPTSNAKWCDLGCILMILKAYRNDLDKLTNIGNSQYKLANLFGITIEQGLTSAPSVISKILELINSCISPSTLPSNEDMRYWCPTYFANYVLESIIVKKTPLIISWKVPGMEAWHSAIIVGYTIPSGATNYDQLKFIIHDPTSGPYTTFASGKEFSFSNISQNIWVQGYFNSQLEFTSRIKCFFTEGTGLLTLKNPNKSLPIAAYGDVDKKQVILQTIQMNHKTVKFVGNAENYVIYNKDIEDGYGFENQNNGKLPDFDKISINGVPIFDTDLSNTITPKVQISVTANGLAKPLYLDDNVSIENTPISNGAKKYVIKNYDIDWKLLKTNGKIKPENTDFTLEVALVDQSNPTIRPDGLLDSFTVKFKYTPPKSLLSPKKTGMYLDENYKIELKYGYSDSDTNSVDVASQVEWSVEGGGTITGGVFKPNGPGTYKITAILRKGTKLSNNEIVAEDVTISFFINVNDAYINPAQKNININETVDFSLKYGTNEVDAADVTKITSWSADSGEIVVNGDGKAIYTPSTAGTFIITATLVKDTAFSTYEVVMENIVKTAEVTVSADLKIVPASKIMLPSESFKFAAMVDDATRETGIIWSAPDGGSITPVGLYTAPNNAGTYIVKASFGTVEATAEVTVMAADLKISPPAAVLNRSQQMTFKALVGDTTQETGIAWSVVSLNGGSINQTGVYTAPAQWGKYVIKAAHQGIEATAEVKVNDERIMLLMDNPTTMPAVQSSAIKADGTSLNSSGYTGFYVYGYGADASTIELSIVEGQGKGRVQFVSKQYNTDWYWLPWKTRLQYYYYAPDSNQPLYDTNEIIHINAKCPDNSNTVAANSIMILRPQLSETQEVVTNAGTYDERKWQFKSIGYRAQNSTWSNAAYKNSNMIHGLYLGIFTRNNMAAYIQHYYCGEATGEHLTYYNNPGDERHGKLVARYVYTDFIKYKYERWEYTTENRYDPKTGYTTGPYKVTNKVTENYQRANINQSWSIILPQVFEKFDGWVTP